MTIEQHPYVIEARIRAEIREGRASIWQVLGWLASGTQREREHLR